MLRCNKDWSMAHNIVTPSYHCMVHLCLALSLTLDSLTTFALDPIIPGIFSE